MKRSIKCGVLGVVLAVVGHSAWAQQVAAELDEIIVTAQKREQLASDVAISMVAVTGSDLETAGVFDMSQLAKAVPGFTAATSYDGLPIYSLRGVGFVANQLAASPAVSTYVDEVTLPFSAMTAGAMLDLQRVEVLKGPQGTLFGQNSTGGAINFVAAKPTDTFASGGQASFARFGQFWTEDYLSGPLSGTVKARVAVTTTQGGNWQYDYTDPDRVHGAANKAGARIILDWSPSEAVKFSLNVNGNYDKSDVQLYQLVKATPQVPGNSAPGLVGYRLPPANDRAAGWDLDSASPFAYDNNFYQTALRGDFLLSDSLSIVSISNYAHMKSQIYRDYDGTDISTAVGGNDGTIESISQEFRLLGSLPVRGLHYIVGANASRDAVDEVTPQDVVDYSALPPNTLLNTFANFTSKTLAGFADADWQILDGFTLTAGARFTKVKETDLSCTRDGGTGKLSAAFGGIANLFRSLDGLPPTDAYVAGGCATVGPASTGYLPFLYDTSSVDHNVPWRVGASFKPDKSSLIYATVSRGFKAGAYPFENTLLSSQYAKVNQEELTAYELGIKLSHLRTFDFDVAGFYYNYLEKQTYGVTQVPILGRISVLTNIPKSHASGFDVNSTWIPLTGLTIRGGLTYSKTVIENYSAYNEYGVSVDVSGRPFPFSPTWSGTLDTEYRFPVSDRVTSFVGASLLSNSEASTDLAGSPDAALRPYTTVDVRAGLSGVGGWTTTLWARNITDRYYTTGAYPIVDVIVRTTGMPTTYGVTFGYKF